MSSDVIIRWLGTNAWEVRGNGKTVLVDPWVTRFHTGATDDEGEFDPDTRLEVDESAVDEHIGEADTILITHSHYDHIADVPYVAGRTGATVLGNETHLNLLRAMKTPDDQLAQVEGGEFYAFDGYTVRVFPATHSVNNKHKRQLFGGTAPGPVPKRPKRVKDLLEGGSLNYLVTFGTVSLFFTATPGFHEREIDGIRPTVLFLQGGNPAVYPNYEQRIFAATGHPPYVVPTHWDDFEADLKKPAIDRFGAEALREKVAAASPGSQWVQLDHLESYTFSG